MDTEYILWPELPPDEKGVTRRRLLVVGTKAAAGAAALFGGLAGFAPSTPFAQSIQGCTGFQEPCTLNCTGACVAAFLGPSCCDAGNPGLLFCCGCASPIKGCPPAQVEVICGRIFVVTCCVTCG
jgi:hypothetical protein